MLLHDLNHCSFKHRSHGYFLRGSWVPSDWTTPWHAS